MPLFCDKNKSRTEGAGRGGGLVVVQRGRILGGLYPRLNLFFVSSALTHGGGGDVHEADAAVEGARDHAANVVHDAAAHGDDATVFVDALAQDLVVTATEHCGGLVLFGPGDSRLVNLVRRDHHLGDDEFFFKRKKLVSQSVSK